MLMAISRAFVPEADAATSFQQSIEAKERNCRDGVTVLSKLLDNVKGEAKLFSRHLSQICYDIVDC